MRVAEVEAHTVDPERWAIGAERGRAPQRRARRAAGASWPSARRRRARSRRRPSQGDGRIAAGQGESNLFIYPGHRFRAIGALMTNFHLPESSLLMLVSAFGGRERVLAAYAEAVRERYRFYSYGDAMLVV